MEDGRGEPDNRVPGERVTLPLINETHVTGRLTNGVMAKDYGEGENKRRRAQFVIAVPRPRKVEGQPEAEFITIIAWRDVAKQCEGLGKGDGVEVQGRLRTWDDEAKRRHWGITADTVQLIVRRAPKAAAPRQRQRASA